MDRSPSIYYKKVLREVEQAEKRRRFALIAKINLDIMGDQEHDRRVRGSTQIERSWVVRYPSGTEVRHEHERGARAASSNPETVVREECRRVTPWKGK